MGRMDFDKMNEAFRAGNRARKKESVGDAAADMHNPLQDQIDRFREQTGVRLEIKDGRPYYKGNSINYSGNADIPDNMFVEGDFSVSIWQERLPAGLTVTGMLDLEDCKKLTELPPNITACDLKLTHSGIKKVPRDTNITGSFIIYGEDDQDLDRFFREDCGLRPLTVNAGSEYRPDFENRIIGFSWNRWRTVGKPDFDKIHNMLTANEAFRAGNRARKKEAIADTVSVGLTPKQQVKLFMADVMKYREWLIQQGNDVRDDTVNPGKDNEVPVGVYYEDGIDDVFRIEPDGTVVIRSIVDFTDYPYEIHFPEKVQCNALVNLINCDGLTHLPDNMYVEDHLNLERCKNLRRLPQNLYVGYDLYLNGCTALEEIPDSLYIGWGDLDLENCPKIRSLSVNMTLKDGRILFSENSPLHKFFDDEDINYAIRKAAVKTTYDSKWGECSFNDWNAYAAWVKSGRKTVNEAFRAGNNARKKESVQDTVESVGDRYPVAINGPAELIKRLMEFLDGLGYEKTLNRLEMTPHKQQNGVLKYYGNINERYPSLGGNYIKISLGRHPMWNERRCKFCNTGLTLEIEANEDRMFYRIQYLPADEDTEDSVQFLNCLSDRFDAWEKPDGTRWGKPRNREALDDKDIPAVWPNMFKNIAEASSDPTLVFVPDPVYSRCWKFEKPGAVHEAFRAGNRARKQEAVQDTVQTTGEYRPVTRELFKDVVDSFVNPTEGPISGLTYRRYDQHMTGQSLVNYLDRILELCGYKDMLKAEVVFEDDTCDGVQITDDKNRSVSRMAVQYNRDYVCVLTGSMDTGMPGLLYAYRNLPNVLEIHLEGIDSLNADLREYIEKFG